MTFGANNLINFTDELTVYCYCSKYKYNVTNKIAFRIIFSQIKSYIEINNDELPGSY